MKRNAFISNREGKLFHFEPDFQRPVKKETMKFQDSMEDVTKFEGGAICLSPYITVDSLLALRSIITDELTTRAKAQLEEITQ